MRLHRRRAHANEGFSLIEVIIAMGLLATGLLAVALGQLSAVHLSRQSRYLTHAVNLAQQQMEIFQLTPNANMPASGTYNDPNNPMTPLPNDDPANPNPDRTTYVRRWTIAQNTPFPGVTTITVQVDWVDRNGLVRTTSIESMRGL